MQYTQEMILRSDSGYCMPYEEKGRDVQMSLGYGKQKHPHTGEPLSQPLSSFSSCNREDHRTWE